MTLISLSLVIVLKLSERDEDKGKQRPEMKTGRRKSALDDL